jgi:hypothetical protein
MRRQLAGIALMVCGMLALSLGMMIVPTPVPAAASPALQPSPRPPVEQRQDPIPPPPPVEDDGHREPTPIPAGRITGTVIDLRTGAPQASAQVAVGAHTVTSDANGNYDIWVEAGLYPVALQLADSQGVPALGAQDAMVWGNDVVTLHLFFTSPAPAVATPTPAPVVQPVEQPVALPAPDAAAAPASLPQTSGEARAAEALLLAGFTLLMLGALLAMLPRRMLAQARAADRRLLGSLLARAPRPAPEETLRDLLRRDP